MAGQHPSGAVRFAKPLMSVITDEMEALGEPPCTLYEFAEANADAFTDQELAGIVDALERGETVCGGGGAEAKWRVSPAPKAPPPKASVQA